MGKGLKETRDYIFFWGSFLSNFHDVDEDILHDGHLFPTSEHIFMYEKAKLFGDLEKANEIIFARTPMQAKRLGREVQGFNDELWEKNREAIMIKALKAKFKKGTKEYDMLKATKNKTLVEGSPYDRIWGVGLHYDDKKILNPNNWRGLNLLGKSLMKVRER